jgi:16S rRNA (guanine966-N2)-methyltransferase
LSSPRIIAGKAKGLRLQSVPGDITRPITDRTKEALFNILGADIINASFLDLFAGTGSVGIESLSRGASFVRFIDINLAAITTIKHNLDKTRLTDGAEVIHNDALSYLKHHPDRVFDYIYVAPPQYKHIWQRALNEIDANPKWLSKESWIIVQIHPVEYQKLTLNSFVEFEQRRYGSTLLVFYENTPE